MQKRKDTIELEEKKCQLQSDRLEIMRDLSTYEVNLDQGIGFSYHINKYIDNLKRLQMEFIEKTIETAENNGI